MTAGAIPKFHMTRPILNDVVLPVGGVELCDILLISDCSARWMFAVERARTPVEGQSPDSLLTPVCITCSDEFGPLCRRVTPCPEIAAFGISLSN